tara:strand:+ start:12516 stop:14582 length:2067 start_codon:yes stop_codon:yes gene_type:complete
MAGSTFNLRGCSSVGGSAGNGGGCGINVSVPAITGTPESSATEIATRATTLLRESISREIREHLADTGIDSRRIAFETILTYDCPKVGDVVRWDKKRGTYDKAYAKYDLTPGIHDREHLTEVIGVVERVETICDGSATQPTGINTNATIVMFGHIRFEGIDLDNNALEPGTTYFLWDQTFPEHISFASNLSTREPAISKPILLATGPSEGIIQHYRPMTGSSSGGQTELEEYVITPTLIEGGWQVEIQNIGSMSSRFPLVVEVHYNRLLGGDDYIMYKEIGALRSSEQAIVLNDESNKFTFNVTKDSSEFGIVSGDDAIRENGVNGVGEITVKVKTTNGDNWSKSSIRDTIPFATSAKVRSIPNLQITGRCAEAQQVDIEDKVVGPGGQINESLTEGAMYEIRLEEGVGGSTNTTPLGFEIDMATDLYVEMRWTNDNSEIESVITNFSLPSDGDNAVEIFPANESNGGITERQVTLRIKTSNGEDLPSNHWAQYLTQDLYPILCSDEMCCGSDRAIISSNSGNSVSISELLDNTDNTLINNPNNARLYTMADGSNIIWPTGQKPVDALEVSWKNVREDIQICYPVGVKSGSEPAFMTIYANEARPFVPGQSMDSFTYDPRYILAEIGAQETLNGQIVKMTINYGTSRQECCFSIQFNGTLEGTHYTIAELCESGLLIGSTLGCPQSCG